ncbi:MAG: glycosyltransferase [Phycisphaeraceae bacterium]
MPQKLNIVILGLSITSSWGNGHATIYRALVRALEQRGHRVLFLERDKPWYADNRDLPQPPHGRTALYQSLNELNDRFRHDVHEADLVIVGSYVPEGVDVGRWVLRTAAGHVGFYDIDTPITLSKLQRGDYEYLTPDLIRQYPLYLSFTGGPILDHLQSDFGSPMARPFYCCVDPDFYGPDPASADHPDWDLGYMGTWSQDRMPKLERLLIEPAHMAPQGRFVVAGPQYPADYPWPVNVERIDHLPPSGHRAFYNRQRFTLNLTRQDMVTTGYAPSVRLFEAATCGTPIISDPWPGLAEFFEPEREILLADGPQQVLEALNTISESERRQIGERARQRVLAEHTAAHRVQELEQYVALLRDGAGESEASRMAG